MDLHLPPRAHHWPALLFCALALPAAATAIQWNSKSESVTNTDSSGSPLDDSWSFYLGAFLNAPGGWMPGAANTGEWNQHWVTADVSGYFPPFGPFVGRFSSEHSVNGTIPVNTQAYIWGTNRDCPNGEWILLTDVNWTWPANNPIDLTVTPFTLESTTVAVVGQIDSGTGELMTAAVTNSLPPLLTGPNWLELHFTDLEITQGTLTGWMADPNGNGRPNLLEFALDANPRKEGFENEPVAGTMEVPGSTYLTLTMTKDPNVAIDYGGEVSGDLDNWSGDAGEVVLESATAKELVFRDLMPIETGDPAHFLRIKVNLTQ